MHAHKETREVAGQVDRGDQHFGDSTGGDAGCSGSSQGQCRGFGFMGRGGGQGGLNVSSEL